MKRSRRVVGLVYGESFCGRRRVAFGVHGVAKAAGVSVRTVERAVERGEVVLEDLEAVARWIGVRRGWFSLEKP